MGGINLVLWGLGHNSDGREVPGYESMIFTLRTLLISKGEITGNFLRTEGRNELSNKVLCIGTALGRKAETGLFSDRTSSHIVSSSFSSECIGIVSCCGKIWI